MANTNIDADMLKETVKHLDTFLWDIANNVVCRICHELFKKPVTTTCGHNFCSSCLKQYLYSAENLRKGCPLCRCPTKNRGSNNHILLKVANLCSKFPVAFKDDVLNLSPVLYDIALELVNHSRISEISTERDKSHVSGNKNSVRKKRGTGQGSKRHDSTINHKILNDNSENKDDSMDFKSVSQVPSTAVSSTSDSNDIATKIKKVEGVPSKQKVRDWLQKVDASEKFTEHAESQYNSYLYTNNKNSVIQQSTSNSMIRIDYDKSKKSNVTVDDPGLSKDEADPYEFIASQKTAGRKSRKCSSKRRKKTVPEYETIQNFTKERIKKICGNDDESKIKTSTPRNSPVFSDINDENLKRTLKTYSGRSNLTKTVIYNDSATDEGWESMINSERKNTSRGRRSKCRNTKPSSPEGDSMRMPRARRKILPVDSDVDTDNSMEKDRNALKKAKLDILDNPSPDDDIAKENIKYKDNAKADDSKVSSSTVVKAAENSCHSPGWSRVSNLRNDFETAEKKTRYRRRSLNISGGEVTLNNNKKNKNVDMRAENDKDTLKDMLTEDLNKTSELITGFDSPCSVNQETNVKNLVETVEFEPNILGHKKITAESNHEVQNLKSNIVEPLVSSKEMGKEPRPVSISENCLKDSKQVEQKTPNRRTIPFALLGRIRKKKRTSIVFLKLGQLTPVLKRSGKRVSKLIFHKTVSRKIRTSTKGTQTDASFCKFISEQSRISDSLQRVHMTGLEQNVSPVKKVEVEVQTTQSFFQSCAKEVQTVEKTVTDRSVGSDNDALLVPTQIFAEFNTPNVDEEVPKLDVTGNDKQNGKINIDSEIECELNMTWATQAASNQENTAEARQNITNARKEEEVRENDDDDVIDLVSNGTEVLIAQVMDNIKMDLDKIKAVAPENAGVRQERCEESDSDIFIEQTPPKNSSANSLGKEKVNNIHGIGTCEEAKEGMEESFLILSECQSNVPDYDLKSTVSKDKPKAQIVHPTKHTFSGKENTANNQNKFNGEVNVTFKKPFLNDRDICSSQFCKKVCIVTSGITNRNTVDVFVTRFKVEYSSTSKKEMTHLVVGLHKNDDTEFVPFCTPKLLYAMSNKKWVVTEAWVEKCLQANAIVGEEPYESVDPVGGNGCTLARLSTKPLLENCEVYLLGKQDGISTQDFAALIISCGGTVVNNPSQFSFSPKKIRMILADCSEPDENPQFEVLKMKYKTLVMSRNLLIVSIQSYTLVNFVPYILHSFSVNELLKWGYPYELVNDIEGGSETE